MGPRFARLEYSSLKFIRILLFLYYDIIKVLYKYIFKIIDVIQFYFNICYVKRKGKIKNHNTVFVTLML